ncbi:hypothetical protein, partial [Cumulibacter manganitolerans]|uniref:hypothetical protein n=1 Tax=Cumulibacter manganitolerans TaxID=1884992 RepID=UPI0012978085
MAGNNFGAPDPDAHYPGVPSGSYYPPPGAAPDPQPANHDLYYADINTHYVAISREEPETIKSAGDAWVRIGTALGGGAEAIRRRGITLSGSWEGAAKEAFLLKVGLLTSVLDDWAGKAHANGVVLRDTLYPVIRDKRTAMAELWREYKGRSDDIREQENANASLGELWEDTKEAFGGKDRLSANLEHYSQRSRSEILDPMSAAFDRAFLSMSTGAVYQGPKDAVVKTLDPSSVGGAPGAPAAPAAAAPDAFPMP